MRTRKKLKIIFPIISLLIFIFILSQIDLAAALNAILSANPYLITLAVLIHIPVILIKSEKWRMLLRKTGGQPLLFTSAKAWVFGFFLGIVTPGRVGDFSRAYYIRGETKLSRGISSVVLDRVIDIASLFLFAFLGILMIFAILIESGMSGIIYILPLFFMVFIVGIFLLTRKGLVKTLASPIFKRIVPARLKPEMKNIYNDFYRLLEILRKKKRSVIPPVLFALLAFAIILSQHYILAVALGLDVSFLYIFSIIPIVLLLDTLPISFSGIGTRDLALIFFLGLAGISPEISVSYSLLIFFVNYIVVAVPGMIVWLRIPESSRKGMKGDL